MNLRYKMSHFWTRLRQCSDEDSQFSLFLRFVCSECGILV